jgi:hypothetical protein
LWIPIDILYSGKEGVYPGGLYSLRQEKKNAGWRIVYFVVLKIKRKVRRSSYPYRNY